MEKEIITNLDNQLHEVATKLAAMESSVNQLAKSLEEGFKALSEQMASMNDKHKKLEERIAPLEAAHNKSKQRWGVVTKVLFVVVTAGAGVLGAKFGNVLIDFALKLF